MNNYHTEKQIPIRSRVAILGTLAELHDEPIQYDLKMLRRLVKGLQPDLLCAEIHPDDWQTGDLERLSIEYREALIPLARRTDIVIVPVSGLKETQLIVPLGLRWLGLRRLVVRLLNSHLRWIQRMANGPETINSPSFQAICGDICMLIAWVCGPLTQKAWALANQALLENILAAIHRDPGRRVLVTVDCRRSHQLIRELSRVPEVVLVNYRQL